MTAIIYNNSKSFVFSEVINLLAYSKVTKSGDRTVNEDAVGITILKDRACFTLCDGLGGHGFGEVASNIATNAFDETFRREFSSIDDFFNEAFSGAQNAILEEQQRRNFREGIKTTAVSLVMLNDRCKWAHIGDSRLYYFEGLGYPVRTHDHSVSQMLADAGEIREDEIRFHPDRSKLLRALGDDEEAPRFEISESVSLSAPYAFLLCSDGFWEYITEDEMVSTLKKSDTPGGWLKEMYSIVLQSGKYSDMDNFSAISIMNK